MLEDSQEDIIFKYLILAVAIVCLIIFIKEIILGQKILSLPEISKPSREVKIDFEFLRSQELEELFLPEQMSLPEEIGRENPFSHY